MSPTRRPRRGVRARDPPWPGPRPHPSARRRRRPSARSRTPRRMRRPAPACPARAAPPAGSGPGARRAPAVPPSARAAGARRWAPARAVSPGVLSTAPRLDADADQPHFVGCPGTPNPSLRDGPAPDSVVRPPSPCGGRPMARAVRGRFSPCTDTGSRRAALQGHAAFAAWSRHGAGPALGRPAVLGVPPVAHAARYGREARVRSGPAPEQPAGLRFPSARCCWPAPGRAPVPGARSAPVRGSSVSRAWRRACSRPSPRPGSLRGRSVPELGFPPDAGIGHRPGESVCPRGRLSRWARSPSATFPRPRRPSHAGPGRVSRSPTWAKPRARPGPGSDVGGQGRRTRPPHRSGPRPAPARSPGCTSKTTAGPATTVAAASTCTGSTSRAPMWRSRSTWQSSGTHPCRAGDANTLVSPPGSSPFEPAMSTAPTMAAPATVGSGRRAEAAKQAAPKQHGAA